MIVTDAVSHLPRPDPRCARSGAGRDGGPRAPATASRSSCRARAGCSQVMALAHGARRALEVGTAIGVSTLYICAGAGPGRHDRLLRDRPRAPGRRARLPRARRGAGPGRPAPPGRPRGAGRARRRRSTSPSSTGSSRSTRSTSSACCPTSPPARSSWSTTSSWAARWPRTTRSERAETARGFNDQLLSHPELTGTVTPVGDGVLVAVKDGPRS